MDGSIVRVRRNINYGYGVIKSDIENKDYFFIFPLAETYNIGDLVSFDSTSSGVNNQISLASNILKK